MGAYSAQRGCIVCLVGATLPLLPTACGHEALALRAEPLLIMLYLLLAEWNTSAPPCSHAQAVASVDEAFLQRMKEGAEPLGEGFNAAALERCLQSGSTSMDCHMIADSPKVVLSVAYPAASVPMERKDKTSKKKKTALAPEERPAERALLSGSRFKPRHLRCVMPCSKADCTHIKRFDAWRSGVTEEDIGAAAADLLRSVVTNATATLQNPPAATSDAAATAKKPSLPISATPIDPDSEHPVIRQRAAGQLGEHPPPALLPPLATGSASPHAGCFAGEGGVLPACPSCAAGGAVSCCHCVARPRPGATCKNNHAWSADDPVAQRWLRDNGIVYGLNWSTAVSVYYRKCSDRCGWRGALHARLH